MNKASAKHTGKFNKQICIYAEKDALKYPAAQRVLGKHPNANIITIDHYKDVFCRPRQNYTLQHKSGNIILAVKKGKLFYPGAPVCQDFGYGHEDFFYTSCVANCIMDCEYCFLKGMYDCGFLCIFVNLEDYFAQLEEMLLQRPVYLSATYDTDLFPLEKMLGYVGKWCEFAGEAADKAKIAQKTGEIASGTELSRAHPFTVEIRTKFKCLDVWRYPIPENVIFAFSLSSQCVIDQLEHGTSSLAARLENIVAAQEAGANIRLCFDPIIRCDGWRDEYRTLVDRVFQEVNAARVKDVSVGSFRISQDYFRKLRRARPEGRIANFPFENVGGFYQYPEAQRAQMEEFVVREVAARVGREKVFLWK